MAFLRKRSLYCIQEDEINRGRRITFSSVCIITATVSAYGALVQLINWWKRLRSSEPRRMPSPTPHIVFSLALADLLACIGVVAMSVLFITLEPPVKDGDENFSLAQPWYLYIGAPIESFTMFSYVSSFMWTLMYSVDICLQIHNQHYRVSGIAYQIIAWLTPLLLVVSGEVILSCGTEKCSTGVENTIHYLVCYVPMSVVALALPFIYTKAYHKVARNIRSGQCFTDVERNLQTLVRRRFCLIVFIFYICWIVNIIDGIPDLSGIHNDTRHFGISMFQAVLNPLQGLLNCFVYGQHKQFTKCCRQSLEAIKGHKDSETTFSTIESHTTRTLSDEWNINSFDKRASLPYTCPPCLANKSLYGSTDNAEKPFVVRLLGEYSSCT